MRKYVLFATVVLAACQPSESPLISEAKKAVADKVKDPSSVQFKDVKECDTKGMVTGQFNAKNGFGAYTGFEAFIYRKPTAYMVNGYPLSLEPEAGGKFFIHLIDVCFEGGDADFGNFMNSADAK